MKATSVEDVRQVIRGEERLKAVGGRSKSGLTGRANGAAIVDMTGLSGIVEYDASEFTITALAGTPVVEVVEILAAHGQYLPFDPVLVEVGATLGGTVASGLSGPGRYRYGGVRDFIIGVKFLNGEGDLIQGGGKVVKNAAGFDLPKLMVGSLGQFGVLVELSFKVFPRPEAFTTLQRDYLSLQASLSDLKRLSHTAMDIYAVDLLPQGNKTSLMVRLGGDEQSFPARVARLQALLGGGDILPEAAEPAFWRSTTEFDGLEAGLYLVKVPVTPERAPELEGRLAGGHALRRYSVGANVAWVSWPGEIRELDHTLSALGLSGLVVLGETAHPLIGVRVGQAFAKRIKVALDPNNKWVEV
ncbi:MAG TPA: FAD-binding protein [Anaerolineales bacterium]